MLFPTASPLQRIWFLEALVGQGVLVGLEGLSFLVDHLALEALEFLEHPQSHIHPAHTNGTPPLATTKQL